MACEGLLFVVLTIHSLSVALTLLFKGNVLDVQITQLAGFKFCPIVLNNLSSLYSRVKTPNVSCTGACTVDSV